MDKHDFSVPLFTFAPCHFSGEVRASSKYFEAYKAACKQGKSQPQMAKFVHCVLHFELLKPFNILDFHGFSTTLEGVSGFLKRSSPKTSKVSPFSDCPFTSAERRSLSSANCMACSSDMPSASRGSKGQKMETKERGSRVARVLGPKWGGNHHI